MTLGERLRSDAQRLERAALAWTPPLSGIPAWTWVLQVFHGSVPLTGAQRVLREQEPEARFDLAGYADRLQRLIDGEPIAYVLGVTDFFGREFRVDANVLIPRPDTETLVGCALDHLPAGRQMRVLDLGTGSGCVAVTLALERPACEVVAVDASPAALAVAIANAARLGAAGVRFQPSDWFDAVAGERFDVIVSNPPYLSAGDPHLPGLVHEPTAALVSGSDGLDAIRRIAAAAPDHLRPGGVLLLEHGWQQRDAVVGIVRTAGFVRIEVFDDPGGQPRVVVAAGRTD